MEGCQLQHLWKHFYCTLPRLNTLSCVSRRKIETDFQSDRSFLHLSVDCRDIYTTGADNYARRMGMVHVWSSLGAGLNGNRLQNILHWQVQSTFALHLPVDGLDDCDCAETNVGCGAWRLSPLVGYRWGMLHSRSCLLCLERISLSSYSLAPICAWWKCRPFLWHPPTPYLTHDACFGLLGSASPFAQQGVVPFSSGSKVICRI